MRNKDSISRIMCIKENWFSILKKLPYKLCSSL